MRVGWNEPAATPSSADSSRGYADADRHFAPNSLLPDVVTIESDRDLRAPAGLIAIERVTRQIMAIPGVRTVQSASRPAGVDTSTCSTRVSAFAVSGAIDQRLTNAAPSALSTERPLASSRSA